MKILIVIHGYPPFYMAGSEVYTYNIARELTKTNEVYVFHRIEDKTMPLYKYVDTKIEKVNVRYINNYEPKDATFYDKYLNPKIDDAFREYVQLIKPDVVHIGHLSHLSTQIPIIAKREFGLPVLFTIHDFWMFCHRGQLINPKTWEICQLPNIEQCTQCAAHHYNQPDFSPELILERNEHIRNVIDCIDIFFAPSHTLEKFFLDMGVDKDKIYYSKYGFNISNIKRRIKRTVRPITFGFMGRIIYTKGVHLLCEAFCKTQGDAQLVIWGDANNEYGKKLQKNYAGKNIIFKGQYHNDDLQKVLDSMDVMVCPSIWLENAPLVIQEAQCAHIPIITSNKGGMAELVHDGVDGFTFAIGDIEDLRKKIQLIINQPQILDNLKPSVEQVRSVSEDAKFCLEKYKELTKEKITYPHRPSPWRITFITNPDKCNLRCKMCDTFSETNRHRLHENHRPNMDYEIIKRTIERLKYHGLKEIIPSTMGEPLLYPHFEEMLNLCKKHGIKMNITTNGTFPGGVEYWTDKLLDSVSDIKFSINGITPKINEEIMCGINTNKQKENIIYYIKRKQEKASKCTVTLQCTFMKTNIRELEKIIKWGIEHKVDRIKGHHLWKTSDNLNYEMLRTKENAKIWNEVCDKCHKIADGKIKIENFTPITNNIPNINSDDTFCQFLGKELWIEYDGSYQICCCPSKIRTEFGDFGNANKTTPISMWNSEQYINFIKNWGNNEICKKCNMRNKKL